ncbi:MAG TPA: lytic murein transglycosylase [Gammaproteobacteria bacterium]
MYKPLFTVLFVLLPLPALAADEAEAPGFGACLARLQAAAADAGISASTLKTAMDTVEPIKRVIAADRQQPEFFYTFWHYLDSRVTPTRVERGRELYRKHYELLHEIDRRFGVRPEYLLAFWGMETNYGSYFGSVPVLDALATLACDQRRSEMFTREFVNALSIHETGSMDLTRVHGSWAGAMGHTQFLPSTYLGYAVDYDRDGRRDLFGSLPDAFASSANYLTEIGWEGEQRWGREVLVPFKFDWSLAGLNTVKTVSEWRALGLRDAFGRPLPHSEMKGSLLLPMGHKGPAFLVYDNFHVIMQWNHSISYALAVGYLADRIAGMGQLTAERPEHVRLLSNAEVTEIQSLLNKLGYESGEPDGVVGRMTRTATRAFEAEAGLPADGYPDHELLEQLRVAAR